MSHPLTEPERLRAALAVLASDPPLADAILGAAALILLQRADRFSGGVSDLETVLARARLCAVAEINREAERLGEDPDPRCPDCQGHDCDPIMGCRHD